MPNDVDCGNGEDQFETIYAFAKLYEITGNNTYLDFSERVAATKPSSPPDWCKDCVCGPPNDWDCGPATFQLGQYKSYEILYRVTKNPKYKAFMENLLKEFENKQPIDRGIYAITLYVYAYNSTQNPVYLEIAKQKALNLSSSNYVCGPPNKWQCPNDYNYHQSKIISLYASLYRITGDKEFLDRAIKFADAGGTDCGPITGNWTCSDPMLQVSMAAAYYKMYKLTGEEKYLNYFNNLISTESLEKINCKNFDCHDAEFNSFFAIVLLKINGNWDAITYLN
jgi:rhamnogalacturonyl hydrolase YesR